jgi:pimeloyl-ACP methyl ester carboxylesterase
VFFLTGGPGQAATESYLGLASAFYRINQKRDIVLVDQRGTGGSNPLTCDAADEESTTETEIADYVETCLAQMEGDPRFYTTTFAMQDLDAVREALGYQQINLYGVSYGTRAAQTYLKFFPERVRSVVLDGVVPQDEALGIDVARDAQRALDNMFARCQQDNACSANFPQVSTEFDELLDQLREQPAQVTLEDPLTGEKDTSEFDLEQFVVAIRLLSYAPESVAFLPLLIHTAYEQQDFSTLAAQYRVAAGSLTSSISGGMGNSVLCTEDTPFIKESDLTEKTKDTYYGDLQIKNLEEVCALWPVIAVDADFKRPVQTNVPVLLLSGEDDPVTPPENAEEVAAFLPNSLALVAPGQGHNVVLRGCIPDLMYQFVLDGSVENLNGSCVGAIQPAPFFVDFNGPQP